ncbi:MAG TPA: HAD-IA family hydrolase [Polyangiales bacterium]|nr:HAD-IA family hydrolase [Polyangiales bacterium]
MPAPLAILFDADGVIQRPGADFRAACSALLGASGDALDVFMRELFAVEKPALTGERDFVVDLSGVLERHGAAERITEALAIWTAIEIDAAMHTEIATLRKNGIVCCLATNQQPYRGAHMSKTMGYRELFDHEFYSHALGFAKPDSRYFRAIADRLALTPEQLLFIDDHESNVLAAREVGLHAELFPRTFSSSAAELHAILQRHGLGPAVAS